MTVHTRVAHDGDPVAKAARSVGVVEFGEVDREPAEAVGSAESSA